MKRIIIDKEYVIDIDDFNYTLMKKHTATKKDGTKYQKETNEGYFGSLESVLNKVIKLKIIDCIEDEITLAELRDICDNVRTEVREICSQLGI